jgi:lysine 6-dehydrogenase
LKDVREMDEKTIRWPGHLVQIRTLIDCGLLQNRPVPFDGRPIVPSEFVAKLLSERLSLGKDRDITLLRVDVTGMKGGKRVHQHYDMIDHYDVERKMTSMARTTGFPCSIAAQLLGADTIAIKGVIPPELAFRGELRKAFMRHLADRGIKITSNKTIVNS